MNVRNTSLKKVLNTRKGEFPTQTRWTPQADISSGPRVPERPPHTKEKVQVLLRYIHKQNTITISIDVQVPLSSQAPQVEFTLRFNVLNSLIPRSTPTKQVRLPAIDHIHVR